MKPLFSICITNNNEVKLFEKTLKSINKQTYSNYEVIIIDNFSAESLEEIVESFDNYKIKIYSNSINLKTYDNINNAISLCNGDFVTVLHPGDVLCGNFLEKIVSSNFVFEDKKVFVTAIKQSLKNSNKHRTCKMFKTGGLKSKIKSLIKLHQINGLNDNLCFVFHKDCIEKTGLFSNLYDYASEYDYLLCLAEHYEFVYLPEPLVLKRKKYDLNKDIVEEHFQVLNNNILKNKIYPAWLCEEVEKLRCRAFIAQIQDAIIENSSKEIIEEIIASAHDEIPLLKEFYSRYLIKTASILDFHNKNKVFLWFLKYLFKITFLPNKWLLRNLERDIKEKIIRIKSFNKFDAAFADWK